MPSSNDFSGKVVERYRKIKVKMWGDEKFRRLSAPKPSGQFLWVHLLTGPHTTAIPGLSSIGEAGLAEQLGWSLQAFRACWKEVAGQALAQADWQARVVFLPNGIAHNEPESPSVVKSWVAQHLGLIPECPLKQLAIYTIGKHLSTMGAAWAAAWVAGWESAWSPDSPPVSSTGCASSGAGAGAGTGERDKEKGQPDGQADGQAASWPSPQLLIEKYNRETPDECPSVKSISPGRIKKAKAYLTMFPSEEWWTEVFLQFHRSRYLRGLTNGTQEHPAIARDFDWLLSKGHDQTENAVKVHDGRYRDG
jgi:hypothetical protein